MLSFGLPYAFWGVLRPSDVAILTCKQQKQVRNILFWIFFPKSEFCTITPHRSKSDNQGDFKTPIENISLTSKLISPKQLNNFYGKRESVCVQSRWTQFGSSLQCVSYRQKLPAKVAKTEPIFSIDQSINHFFPLCLPCDFSCTAAHLDARSSAVFWANLSGISPPV